MDKNEQELLSNVKFLQCYALAQPNNEHGCSPPPLINEMILEIHSGFFKQHSAYLQFYVHPWCLALFTFWQQICFHCCGIHLVGLENKASCTVFHKLKLTLTVY